METEKTYLDSQLADQYTADGYTAFFNKIDFDVVAEDAECNKCGARMRYIGLIKPANKLYSASQIAIAHCDKCGNEYEF